MATETRHDGQGAYTYDSFNRLAQVTLNGATLGSYLSNAFNQRAAKTAGGVTRRFVHGPGGQLLAEIGAAQS